jgi:3-phosphoshikimate 1-carboxyvinyltransferase
VYDEDVSADREMRTVRTLRGRVTAPPSKSVTQRALIAAALARGRSELRNPLLADDSRHLIAALNELGIPVRIVGSGEDRALEVDGQGGAVPARSATLAVGNAGTAMRFLTALAALGRGSFVIDGDPRMRERPIEDLLEALRALGAGAESVAGNGCPPVRVVGGLRGGTALLRGTKSSQYLSAILLVGPAVPSGVQVEIADGLVSRPYVDLTIGLMRRFGADVVLEPPGPQTRRFIVRQGASYRPTQITIEGDYSSASYFFAAAAIAGGTIRVDGLDTRSSQGDARFPQVLSRMGCRVEEGEGFVEVHGGDPLKGVDVDCGAMPDIVPTLAVAALFAGGPTRISGVPHLRLKETDRIEALVAEISRLGGEALGTEDGLTIVPRPLTGARIETYGDHRLAMAFAVAGLRVPGVVIADPGCVTKSFPAFWDLLDTLTAQG